MRTSVRREEDDFEQIRLSEKQATNNKTDILVRTTSTNKESALYSSGRKSSMFCFAQLLLQILVNYQNQGQFWNLLVLSIPKLSLKEQIQNWPRFVVVI